VAAVKKQAAFSDQQSAKAKSNRKVAEVAEKRIEPPRHGVHQEILEAQRLYFPLVFLVVQECFFSPRSPRPLRLKQLSVSQTADGNFALFLLKFTLQ
jgi:hypothetical protein